MALTPRGRALRWLKLHRGLTEDPKNSNTDRRKDGIRRCEIECIGVDKVPWCGCFHHSALKAGRVVGISSRQASVALIEDDARAYRAPYGHGWTTNPKDVLRGDAVVLFGRGHHVETVRAVSFRRRIVITDGGNTSPEGRLGSQSNGGGSYKRYRAFYSVYGFARANYPGGEKPRKLGTKLANAAAYFGTKKPTIIYHDLGHASDDLLPTSVRVMLGLDLDVKDLPVINPGAKPKKPTRKKAPAKKTPTKPPRTSSDSGKSASPKGERSSTPIKKKKV